VNAAFFQALENFGRFFPGLGKMSPDFSKAPENRSSVG
jgi:hypothetical protein